MTSSIDNFVVSMPVATGSEYYGMVIRAANAQCVATGVGETSWCVKDANKEARVSTSFFEIVSEAGLGYKAGEARSNLCYTIYSPGAGWAVVKTYRSSLPLGWEETTPKIGYR